MISRNSTLDEIKETIKTCLSQLYERDSILFDANNGKGISERCIVFRFAHYLQSQLNQSFNQLNQFFVDCDFNSSYVYHKDAEGKWQSQPRSGKQIQNPDGSVTNRFVDIIVHRRNSNIPNNMPASDFICFEFKKWNNYDRENDINKLERLTSHYHYLYGFLIVFGRKKATTKWTIFKDGNEIESNRLVYENESN